MANESGNTCTSHSSHWQNLNDLTDLEFHASQLLRKENFAKSLTHWLPVSQNFVNQNKNLFGQKKKLISLIANPSLSLSVPSWILYPLCWDCIKTLSGPIGPVYIFIQSQPPILLKAIWPILDFIPSMLGLYKNLIWANGACIRFYTVPTPRPSKGYLAHLGFYTIYVGTV